MPFPSRSAAVVGVYTTKQGKKLGVSTHQLEIEAIQGALADAGLTVADVDGLIPLSTEATYRTMMQWVEQLGGNPTYLESASPVGGIAKATAAIAAGMANVVVLFWGNAHASVGAKGAQQQQGAKASSVRAPRVGDMHWMIHGAYMVPWYALWTQRYMHEFNVPQEKLAEYAVIARHHATLNPASLMGDKGEITVDDVLSSPPVALPLHRLECSLDNEGGYALVVASAEVARNCKKKPVWILGGAERAFTDSYSTFTADWLNNSRSAVKRATDIAFEGAGVTRADIDVAGLYDCFPVTVARDLEEMGFCGRGEGADMIAEGHLRLGGSLPTNTDGGLLSNSHNMNPGGMHAIEVTRQLRGECDRRQVKDARIGVVLSQGWSVLGLAGTAILAAD